jgi:hypothetical protein
MKRSILISQRKYLQDILEQFHMTDCKGASTPIETSVKLSKIMSPSTEEEKYEMENVPYHQAVGSLMYLMVGTRPDIAMAVGAVSQYAANPGREHWQAMKRIL